MLIRTLRAEQLADGIRSALGGQELRSMQFKRHTITLLVTGLASACLFGAATPASKALLAGTQAQVLAGLLYLGAALGVLPVVVRTKSFRRPWQADRRTLLLLTGAIVL